MKAISFEQLNQLAEEGVGDAQYNLAHEYECGGEIPRDYQLALKWYSSAFSSGIDKSAVAAGKLCVQIGKYADAIDWYEKGVAGNDVEAMWRLGMLCEEGRGCEVDYTKAAALYEQACEKTKKDPRDYSGESTVPISKEACWRLGRIYDLGLGCERNVDRAKKCYGDVLCEYQKDWVRGPKWAELYFRYAELLKEQESSQRVLALYEGAAREDYPEAKNGYVNYWLSHTDDEGSRYRHIGYGSRFIEASADSGNRIAMQCLARNTPRYAWKLLRLGDAAALNMLITYYGNADLSRNYVALKGRRLCAIIKNERNIECPFRTAAKKKAEMLSTFATAVEFSAASGSACYKIHQWEMSGELTSGGHWYKGSWLELAVIKKYQPAIDETEKRKNAELEECYKKEILEREAGKNGQWNIDKALHSRLMKYFISKAEAGDATACKVMAEIFRRGDYGVKKDDEAYKKWIVAAARAGDIPSMRAACDLKIDSKDLYDICFRLSAIGDESAVLRCAEMLENGEGCERNYVAAAEMYEKCPYNIVSQRQLYQLYSQATVAPPNSKRVSDLRMQLITGDEIDSTAAAKNILFAIFNEGVPVDGLSEKIKKALNLGTPLVHQYSGDCFSGYGWGNRRRRYTPLFSYEIDMSWLPGKMTDLLLCIFGRQLDSSRCKECLSRLYSLSNADDLSSYQKYLREESISDLFDHNVLVRIDSLLFSNGKISLSDIDNAIVAYGLLPDRFHAILKVMESYGLLLKEPFPHNKNGNVILDEAYEEIFVQKN